MSRHTRASVQGALEIHRKGGLITAWHANRDGSYTVTGRCGHMADGSTHYRSFSLAGPDEAHVFVNALAFAAQAVDAGEAEISVLAQVRKHLASQREETQ